MQLTTVDRRRLQKALPTSALDNLPAHPTAGELIAAAQGADLDISAILPAHFPTATASKVFNGSGTNQRVARQALIESTSDDALISAARDALISAKDSAANAQAMFDAAKTIIDTAKLEADIFSAVSKVAETVLNERGGVTTVVRVIDQSETEVQTIEGDLYHKDYGKLFAYCRVRDRDGNLPNIMLFGGAGNGKTKAAVQISEALGLAFYQINAVSWANELSGSVSPVTGEYTESGFVTAYRDGGVCLLDENDRSEPDALLTINGALADGYYTCPNGERIKRHPDCLIICTANTKGQGNDRKYVGANKLDAAYLSRFPYKLQWDRDDALEARLVGDSAIMGTVTHLRKVVSDMGFDYEIDTRQAKALSDAVRAGVDIDTALEDVVYSSLSADQAMILKGRK